MKVKFLKVKYIDSLKFVPINIAYHPNKDSRHPSVYVGCELGYWVFYVQFRWHTKED